MVNISKNMFLDINTVNVDAILRDEVENVGMTMRTLRTD